MPENHNIKMLHVKCKPLQVRDRGRESALAIMVITAAMFCVYCVGSTGHNTNCKATAARASDKWSRPSVCVPKTGARGLKCARSLLLIIKLVTCARRALCDSPLYLSVSFGAGVRRKLLVCQQRRLIYLLRARGESLFDNSDFTTRRV
jgi:hypothetical protein